MGWIKAIAASLSNEFGLESEGLTNKMAQAKQIVMNKLKRLAVETGGNAILGVNLEYTMFGDSIIGVIVSGTAASIEKIEE